MLHFLVKDLTPQQMPLIKTIAGIFAVCTLIELVGYSRSFALSQLSLAIFFSVMSCYFLLYYSKKTIPIRSISKRKKQESFAYELFIPLFTSIVAIIFSVALLFFIAPQKMVEINARMMLSFTLASSILFTFAIIRLVRNKKTSKITVALGFQLLLLAIPILLSLGAASSALYNGSNFLDRFSAFIIAFYIGGFALSICQNAIKYLLYGSSSKLDLLQVFADLQAFEGISKVENLQAWTITSNLFGVKCQIIVQQNGQLPQQIVDQATDYILQKYNIEHISFEVINQQLGDYRLF